MTDRSTRPAETSSTGSIRRTKSFQGHQYRRKSKPISEQYKADLTRVLGLTVKNNTAFDCNEATGNIAFPAGCVIVVCQVRKKKEFHICNTGHKSITCLRFSIDGQYIVTGEGGHLPCVRVFSVSDRCQLSSFQSHKYGISCVAFSPNSQYVISVGYQHDNVINVWNWRKNALAATNKVSIKVRALAFSEHSNTFVTVGNRHVKFWYIENSKVPDTETVPLKGRSGILNSLRHQLFCDVACGVGCDSLSTYVLSRSGLLCQFNESRTIVNSVQLEASVAYCISVVNGHIVCGCGAGKILIYNPLDLSLLTSFLSSEKESGLNDTVAVSMDSNNMWIHCVHADHTVKVWDLIDYNCPEEHASNNFHSECVWDIKVQPKLGATSESYFYSCSNDSTVKLWMMQNDDCEMKYDISINTVSQGQLPSKNEKLGIRSLSVSKDARMLAVGDRTGVIHVYETDGENEPRRMSRVEIHSGDILDVSFASSDGMLASASRDRYIYILDTNHTPTYTINDHSAAVTAVRFVYLNSKLRLISCGVDKSLYFCTVHHADGKVEVTRDRHIVERHAMHDMTVVNGSVMVACGGNLREYDIDSGKHQRSLRGCDNLSTIIRVTTDPDHNVIAISCADKLVYLLSYASGDLLLELSGHSEVCTSLAFLISDTEQYLITASADSCFFAWKLHRYAKVDENVVTFHHQLDVHSENAEETDVDAKKPCDMNRTAYFAGSELNGTLAIGDNTLNDLLSDHEDKNGSGDLTDADSVTASSTKLLELDMSLPTWLTGEKDKVVKKQLPGGKWANRIHDQYNFLDTPRTVVDWDDINDQGDPSTDSLSQNSDGGDHSDNMEGKDSDETNESAKNNDNTENEVNNSDQSETSKECSKNEVKEAARDRQNICNDESLIETPTDNKAAESFVGDTLCFSQIDDSQDASSIPEADETTSLFEKTCSTAGSMVRAGHNDTCDNEVDTMSIEYLSAHGDSNDSALLSLSSAQSPKHHKREVVFVLPPEENQALSDGTRDEKADSTADNGSVLQKSSSTCHLGENTEDATKITQPNIPPAFADFLDNLSKKRTRSTPKFLPVRSVSMLGFNRTSSTNNSINLLSNSSRTPPENKESQVSQLSELSKSKNCQQVVENLVAAYEQAESLYQKISKDVGQRDVEACVLLQSTFASLKERINALQISVIKEKENTAFEQLLREYSEKLCSMVCDEFQKKSLVKD